MAEIQWAARFASVAEDMAVCGVPAGFDPVMWEGARLAFGRLAGVASETSAIMSSMAEDDFGHHDMDGSSETLTHYGRVPR